MKHLILFVCSVASAWAACASAPYANGYAYCFELTVPHALVPNTDQTDFPIPFVGTYTFLRTAANGGLAQSASGYDIIFTSDNAGSTLMNWEEVNYTATTGFIERYVKGTVTTASDFTFYLFVGKSGVVASQSAGSPWNSGFKAVYHFGSSASLIITDSIGVNNCTNSGSPVTATSGVAGGAGSYVSASSQTLDCGNDASIEIAGPITVESWYKNTRALSTAYQSTVGNSTNASGNGYQLLSNPSGSSPDPNVMYFAAGKTGTFSVAFGSIPYDVNGWHYDAGTYDGTTGTEYHDGATGGTTFSGANKLGSTTDHLRIGSRPDNSLFWQGVIDEVRISDVARSADWIVTTWNSLTNPAAFVLVGPKTPAFTSAAACSPSSNGYAYCRPITVDNTWVGAGGATNYPMLICFDSSLNAKCLTNAKELATEANGGKLKDATNGYDFIFTSDAAGATSIPYERVIQNLTTGAAELWVKRTISDTATTTIYLWYGNAGVVTDQSDVANVWTNYAAVYHFTAMTGTISSVSDSSGNSNTASISPGSVNAITGYVGGGATGVLGSSLAKATPAAVPTGTSQRTVEAWGRFNSNSNIVSIFGYGDADTLKRTVWMNQAGVFDNAFSESVQLLPTSDINNWHHWVSVLPSGQTTLAATLEYYDGQRLPPTGSASTWNLTNTDLRLLDLPNQSGCGLCNSVGSVDEARISTVERSAGWILTEYNNMTRPNEFLYLGAEQAGGAGIIPRRKVLVR